ncbi:hypothetical protein E2C01_054465 [Portunus trituberculatus]|uniref:Uncharacterized protein n=1 Tax=Portunus trituberculatus TaxID=210409 RepID=A0A5B7GJX1_PORTR|nr:hypothetical protein [Portunus trituberculatus]
MTQSAGAQPADPRQLEYHSILHCLWLNVNSHCFNTGIDHSLAVKAHLHKCLHLLLCGWRVWMGCGEKQIIKTCELIKTHIPDHIASPFHNRQQGTFYEEN